MINSLNIISCEFHLTHCSCCQIQEHISIILATNFQKRTQYMDLIIQLGNILLSPIPIEDVHDMTHDITTSDGSINIRNNDLGIRGP